MCTSHRARPEAWGGEREISVGHRLNDNQVSRIREKRILLSLFSTRHSWPLFHYFCLFITVDSEQMLNNIFANDWNRTADLWCRNWPLCQLNHNHCPALIDLVVISNLLLVVVALHFHWSSRKNWQMSIKVAQKVITQENDRFWHLYKNFP